MVVDYPTNLAPDVLQENLNGHCANYSRLKYEEKIFQRLTSHRLPDLDY